jgi:hypothetical protein
VDKDIQRYVQQRLSDDKTLAKWNKDAAIRQEIEAALMHGAQGMYVFLTRLRMLPANNSAGFGGLYVN